MTHDDPLAPTRPALFALAYRMLGSATEAEDVLQDAYLRYAAVEPSEIRSPAAYLHTVVTRLCLDRLKAARHQREQYLGPWLPEPVLTSEADPHQHAERHETITLAFLVLLESLTPPERAVWLLHEVFGYPHTEVAQIVQLEAAHCRQLFHRAKAQLAAQRPRFAPAPAHQQQLVASFLAAVEQGNLQQLTQLLTDDVVFWADSGGHKPAPRRPVQGRATVATMLLGFRDNFLKLVNGDTQRLHSTIGTVNGEGAILIWVGEQLDSVMVCSFVDHEISALHVLRNPQKLHYLAHQWAATSSFRASHTGNEPR